MAPVRDAGLLGRRKRGLRDRLHADPLAERVAAAAGRLPLGTVLGATLLAPLILLRSLRIGPLGLIAKTMEAFRR